jgi:hypothetical protein
MTDHIVQWAKSECGMKDPAWPDQSAAPTVDERLCSLLAEGALAESLSSEEFDALWEHARASRVDVLLAAILRRAEERIPAAARQLVADRLCRAIAIEMLRRREVRRIIQIFDAAKLDVLLLKGVGLAYTVYSEPYLRQAEDIDLFVKRETLGAVEHALTASGYVRSQEPDAELASTQRHYVRADPDTIPHFVDLHWRVANPRLFADALSFEDAWSSSIVVPALGASARTLGVVHALLLACVHRVAHHQDRLDPRWIWDIHLLACRITTSDGDALVRRATRTGMCAVAARGLDLARDRFGTPVAPDLIGRLEAAAPAERATRFLGGGLRQIDILRTDLAAVSSLSDRLRLLREHLFPQRSYIRAVYPWCPRVLLPIAYLARILRGAPKWFRRPAV